VDWVLAQRLKGIWGCLFLVVHTNQTRLSRPFAVFLDELFQLQNHHSSKYLWRPQRLVSYVCLPSPPYAFIDPEISSSSSPSLSIFYLSRTPRSFKPLMPLFELSSSTLFLPPVVVPSSAFVRAFFFFIWAFALPVVDAYALLPHTLLELLCPYAPLIPQHLLPHLTCLVHFCLLLPLHQLLTGLYVSHLDASSDLCGFVFESLAS